MSPAALRPKVLRGRNALVALAALAAGLCLLGCGEREAPPPPPPGSPNVLFVVIDDLVADVGAAGGNPDAGRPSISAPHIDRLAARGMRFARAYAAAPQCNPSRVAVLSGLHPSRTGIYGNEYDARKLLVDPDPPRLPEKFARAGYRVLGCGKIYHYRMDDRRGWDELCRLPGQDPRPDPDDPDSVPAPLGGGPLDGDEGGLRDMRIAAWVAQQLARDHDRPFFLAVGIEKPHLPWYVPRRYFDENPLERIVMPAVREDDLDDVPPIGRLLADPGVGFRAPPDGDEHTIRSRGLGRRVRRAYVAASAFADAALGRILDALDASGHADGTIVVLWSDNGFHFGEKRHWRKATLWEESTHALLVVSAPGRTPPGSRFEGVVGLLDLYPTLVELAGLPPEPGLHGTSFAATLDAPELPWDRAALTTYGPGNHAVRSRRWRYIRYADATEELYDHDADPMEWTNLAGDPAHAEVLRELARWLPREDAPDRVRDSQFRKIDALLAERGARASASRAPSAPRP